MSHVLIVMALKQECQGYFIKENIVYTGVGKVNASFSLTKAISLKRPKIVINLGSAGSAYFKKGDLINCTEFVQRDMDTTGLGFDRYVTPFEDCSEQILKYGIKLSDLTQGICGTGDSFENIANQDSLYSLVDMEAYSLAKVCKNENIPFICVKYITDGADEEAEKDWNKSLNVASKTLYDYYKNKILLNLNSFDLVNSQKKKFKINICLFNINNINFVIDQLEFLIAIFKQNNYEIIVGKCFRDDSLNVLIEDFSDTEKLNKIIKYCIKKNKKISVVMTEHIDFINGEIYAYNRKIDEIDISHYSPNIKSRLFLLTTLSPYIRYIFTLGEYPALKSFSEIFGKTPVVLPYPKIKKNISYNKINNDLIFSGKKTKYRSEVLDKLSIATNLRVYKNYIDYNSIISRKIRNNMIMQSRVNLNIPQDENWLYPSILRIIMALSLGKLTISISNNVSSEDRDFFISIKINQALDILNYVEKSDFYYEDCLKKYNKSRLMQKFPEYHIKIWANTEKLYEKN